MATNPIQKKARQSFLLGIVITLLLAGIVVYFLYNQLQESNKKIEELDKKLKEGKVSVYVLNQDVVSGQILTPDMFMMQDVDAKGIPADATTDIYSLLAAYSLCDENGNLIKTQMVDNKVRIYIETGDAEINLMKDKDGNLTRIKIENGIEVPGEVVKTSEKPLMAKVALKANTIITGEMIAPTDEFVTDDVREQTYSMISLPIDLQNEEYVDIRLMLPDGQDFIVLSKQRVIIPDVGGIPLSDTIKLKLDELDLLTLSSAIVESYQIEGSKLYAIKYVEAGTQDAALENYVPTKAIKQLIKNDPNVVEKAKEEIKKRWTAKAEAFRDQIIDNVEKDKDASKSGIEESTQATQASREQYLSSIYGTEQ